MTNWKRAFTSLIFLSLGACQGSDPMLTTAPPVPAPKLTYDTIQTTANGLSVTFDTRVDILFVIDDSASMLAHTENLSRNINEFVDAFAQVKAIDFHIGFTYVHDSYRYGTIVPAVCGANTDTPGRVNWEAPGTLKPFFGPADKLPAHGRRYLTKDDDFRTLLKSTLDPKINVDVAGVTPLIKKYVDPDVQRPSVCPQGPELEESTTPILGALEYRAKENGLNKGFRRPGAFFVAIIVSDAKDEYLKYEDHLPSDPSRPKDTSMRARITPREFINRLAQDTADQTAKRRFRIFSVVISPGTQIGTSKSSDTCFPDPAFADRNEPRANGSSHYIWPAKRTVQPGENPLVDIAQLTEDQNSTPGGQVLSICSPNYGKVLGRYGYQVQQDALTDVVLNLPRRPQVLDASNPEYATKSLQVFIGNVPLTEGKHWDYDANHVSVTVKGQAIDWNKFPNEKIRVSFTPADETKTTTHGVR